MQDLVGSGQVIRGSRNPDVASGVAVVRGGVLLDVSHFEHTGYPALEARDHLLEQAGRDSRPRGCGCRDIGKAQPKPQFMNSI